MINISKLFINKRCLFRTILPIRNKSTIYYTYKQKQKDIGAFGWLLLVFPTATFALGTWQIQRKKWKESLIADLQHRTNLDPIKLPETLEDLQKLEYHPVHVRGKFLHDKEMYMGPRTLLVRGDASSESSLFTKTSGSSHGYLVITPFKLADRDETILVNRGWVPAKCKDPRTRKKGQIEGEVDVIGIVRLNENRPQFVPSNNEKSNSWFYRDLDQMARVAGTAPIFLDATNDFDVEGGPIGGQTRVSLRNEHLSYILTWYSLCGFTSYLWYKQFIKKAV